MARKAGVSFANLICRFGEKFVLLDYAREIVIPAFTDRTLSRSYGRTHYFFLDVGVEIRPVDNGAVPAIFVYGRLVKDTVLEREQVYSSEQGLVTAPQTLATAPSSFFTLILNNHKLMYLSETQDAPSLQVFSATLQKFLSLKYHEFINQIHKAGKGVTKKQLYLEIPHPVVKVVPLASKASIEEFVGSFAIITHLEFRILNTNDEFQMQETYRQLRNMKNDLGASSTKLIHDNRSGLDEAQAIEQIHASSATGNQEVKVVGKSPDGLDLRGNNQDFKLTLDAAGLPEADVDKAAELVRLYGEQSARGIIMEDAAPDADAKIRRLLGEKPENG